MITPLAYFDLIETFPRPGCAICNLVLRDVEHFLDLLLYERVNEADSHRAFRARRGLCNEHSGQLIQLRGGAVGAAILYRAAINEVLTIIGQTPTDSPAQSGFARFLNVNATSDGKALADRLQPVGACMACQTLAESEQRVIQVFSESITGVVFQEAYRQSDGLCLPHFRRVLVQVKVPAHVRELVTIQTAIWEELNRHLTEFIDKNDHRRSHEPMGAEGDSWRRAAARLAGERGVFGLDAQRKA